MQAALDCSRDAIMQGNFQARGGSLGLRCDTLQNAKWNLRLSLETPVGRRITMNGELNFRKHTVHNLRLAFASSHDDLLLYNLKRPSDG